MSRRRRLALLAAVGACLLADAGCRQDMHRAPSHRPLEESAFFSDRMASRPLVEGTVARGQLREDPHLYEGLDEQGFPAESFPFPVTREVLRRGQDLYNAFCAPCHDRAGTGNGMVVQRGYRQPVSFHEERLRIAPEGYFFDVISFGFGVMPSYAHQISPHDRWAIIAYLRALQLSQGARLAELPAEDRDRLEELR